MSDWERIQKYLGIQFSSLDSSLEFFGHIKNPQNHRLRPATDRDTSWPCLCVSFYYALHLEEKMSWFNARISMGPIIPKDVYKGLPGKLVGVTGAQHRTESLFIFRDTWTEDLSFRKLDMNIWHLSLSWAKIQGIGRRLEQITVKSVPIYLFKSKGKRSSFKITSIIFIFSQHCF